MKACDPTLTRMPIQKFDVGIVTSKGRGNILRVDGRKLMVVGEMLLVFLHNELLTWILMYPVITRLSLSHVRCIDLYKLRV
jgi:hypothetical protein